MTFLYRLVLINRKINLKNNDDFFWCTFLYIDPFPQWNPYITAVLKPFLTYRRVNTTISISLHCLWWCFQPILLLFLNMAELNLLYFLKVSKSMFLCQRSVIFTRCIFILLSESREFELEPLLFNASWKAIKNHHRTTVLHHSTKNTLYIWKSTVSYHFQLSDAYRTCQIQRQNHEPLCLKDVMEVWQWCFWNSWEWALLPPLCSSFHILYCCSMKLLFIATAEGQIGKRNPCVACHLLLLAHFLFVRLLCSV